MGVYMQQSQDAKVQAIVDRLLVDMEKELPPWRQPWSNKAEGLPVSGNTYRPYRGINTFILWAAALNRGWADNRFFTFAQVRKLKGKVKKDEPGTEVLLWRPAWCLPVKINGKKWVYDKNQLPKPRPKGIKEILLLRSFYVWNTDQCEGLPARKQFPEDALQTSSSDAEGLLIALRDVIGVNTVVTALKACYNPGTDKITAPERRAFTSPEAYYSTMFHEYGHGSGHKTRLNRDLSGQFGSKEYAVEELTAESSAAIVLATLGLPYDTQHAAYMKNWASVLRGLPDAERRKAVLGALQRGQRAADWVLSGGVQVASAAHDNQSEASIDQDPAVVTDGDGTIPAGNQEPVPAPTEALVNCA